MKEGEENERIDVHVPLQIGVVFNISAEKHC